MKMITPEELAMFKRKAKGFIRWINKQDGGHPRDVTQDCTKITKAKTFAAAESVLKDYDDGTFLMLVQEG